MSITGEKKRQSYCCFSNLWNFYLFILAFVSFGDVVLGRKKAVSGEIIEII
jgi:hypothetical protein